MQKAMREKWYSFSSLKVTSHDLAIIFLEADKGYDAMRLRQELLKSNILPLIPYRRSKNTLYQESCKVFNKRSVHWKVERTFA